MLFKALSYVPIIKTGCGSIHDFCPNDLTFGLPPPCKAELMPALLCVSFVRRFIVLLIKLLSIHSICLRVLQF